MSEKNLDRVLNLLHTMRNGYFYHIKLIIVTPLVKHVYCNIKNAIKGIINLPGLLEMVIMSRLKKKWL